MGLGWSCSGGTTEGPRCFGSDVHPPNGSRSVHGSRVHRRLGSWADIADAHEQECYRSASYSLAAVNSLLPNTDENGPSAWFSRPPVVDEYSPLALLL